jgi:hypothetical protein
VRSIIATASDGASELFDACHHALEDCAAPLLERARKDGHIRPDLTLNELLTMANAIASAVERAPDRAERADRFLTLLLDGLHPR